MKCVNVISVLLFALCSQFSWAVRLQEKFAWKEVDYSWESDGHREEAVTSKRYIPENNLPLGLDVWQDKLFITVPRCKSGVASSLNYVELNAENVPSPILHPYPSWQANTIESDNSGSQEFAAGRAAAKQAEAVNGPLSDNSSIISTFRIRVDECDRLWVMDTGLADILGNPKQIAPPALAIFDLKTNELIRRYTFTPSDMKPETFFANVIVDIPRNECDNAFAYVPDLGGYGVVVYSFKDNKSWRVKHNFFHFDPLHGDFTVGGVNFQWTDGVFGMALGKAAPDGTRTVYFHALASTKEFSVPNYVLQNETHALSPASYGDYTYVGDRGENGQSSAEHFDERTNVLFYTQVNKDGVGCWNADKSYEEQSLGLVDSNSDSLVFPNELKVDTNGTLWVLSDRMPVFLFKQLNPNEFNYRILVGNTADVIKGTPCDPSYEDNKKTMA